LFFEEEEIYNQKKINISFFLLFCFLLKVPDRNELSLMGQDLDGPLECYGCNYVVSDGHVGMVVTDSTQNINIFQYAPTKAQTYQKYHIEQGKWSFFSQ
jgi:hypothetical protein